MLNKTFAVAASAAILATAALVATSSQSPAQQPTITQINPNIVVAPKALQRHSFWAVGTSENDAWKIAQDRDSVAAYEAFMRDYPQSRFFDAAKLRRRELINDPNATRGGGVTSPPPAPPPPPPPPPVIIPPTPPAKPLPKVIAPAPKTSTPPVILEPIDRAPPEDGPFETRSYEQKMERKGPGVDTGGGVRTVIEAVMTELLPTDQRRAQNGGAAMVLLTATPAQASRNLALCQALFTQLDGATTGEIDVGVRKVDGVVQILRPVYWFARGNRQPKDAGPTVCETRLQNYHFARARAVMASVGLSGDGPFLAVVRTDDRAAGVIDLSTLSSADIGHMVRYFRESYSKRDRIWAPENNTPQAMRNDMIRILGNLGAQISAIPRVVTRAR